MAVDQSEVTRIAALANLQLDDHESERLTEELNDILEHCRTLGQVELLDENGNRGSAASAPERVPGSLARDELTLSLSDLSPSHQEGFFLVPRLPALDAGARHDGSGEGGAS